jgi:hypothetical protein
MLKRLAQGPGGSVYYTPRQKASIAECLRNPAGSRIFQFVYTNLRPGRKLFALHLLKKCITLVARAD